MEDSIIKLDAALLKKVNSVTMENTQGNVGAFELFFELLANLVTLKMTNPVQLFEPFIDSSIDEQEIKETLTLYSDLHNSIIIAFDTFIEGKSKHHLKNNLFNLIEPYLQNSLEDEYLLKRILIPLVLPAILFLKTHGLVIDDVETLKEAMRKKFNVDEEFIEDVTITLMLNTFAQEKMLYDNGFDLTPKDFIYMMIDNVLDLSVKFLKIKKESVPATAKNTIQTDMVELGGLTTYNGINYDGVEKTDPCPCGSGKKYRKCCRKAWEYPLTTLSAQKILSKQKLSIDEIKEYYKLFDKLVVFVQNDYAIKNDKKCLNSIFEVQYDGTYATNYCLMESGEIIEILQYLGNNRNLISLFIDKYKSEFTDEEFKTYKDWSHFLDIECTIMQVHNNSQVLAWDMKTNKIYLVYGLYDSLASIIPKFPFLANMILFPFKGRIVFDGLLLGQDIDYGNNLLRMMIVDYNKDIQSNGIILEIPTED